jgi:hypothetical protein
MSHEEREALLGAQTPDLPDHPSPYRAGAHRLVGIIVVSLLISAAVSLTLIFAMTGGLRERITRDVLAELEAAKAAAQPKMPEEAVIVHVPADVPAPLSADLGACAKAATSDAVLEAVLADPRVADSPWFAANADRAAAALREALEVKPWPEARVLLLTAESLPEGERAAILAAAAEGYVAHCLAQAKPGADARLKAIEAKERAAADQLKALEDRYVEASDDGRVQLGLGILEHAVWTKVIEWAALSKGFIVTSDQPWAETAEQLAAQRAAALEDEARANRGDLSAAEALERESELVRSRMWAWRQRRALDEAQQGAADPSLPRVLRDGKLTTVQDNAAAFAAEARRSALDGEREAIQRTRDAVQTRHRDLMQGSLLMTDSPPADLQYLKSWVGRQSADMVAMEMGQEMLRAKIAYLEANPPAAPASRPVGEPTAEGAEEPADRLKEAKAGAEQLAAKLQEAKEQLDSLVQEYLDAWQARQKIDRAAAEVDESLRLLDALEARIDELDVLLAGEVPAP